MSLNYPVVFTQAARAELIEAQDLVRTRSARARPALPPAVDAIIQRMSQNPKQFQVVFKDMRRALLRRFPYSLFFVIEEDDTLLVIACFHAYPAHWQKRCNKSGNARAEPSHRRWRT